VKSALKSVQHLREMKISSSVLNNLSIMELNDITYKIRGAAYRVHSELGPGLLESVYEAALKYELQQDGLNVVSQVSVPMIYKEIKFDVGFRLDLIVEDKIVVEVKSVESLADVHFKQTLTYLKLKNKPIGLLINFNVASLTDKVSIVRIANSKSIIKKSA
jgi:GxxExxY protein